MNQRLLHELERIAIQVGKPTQSSHQSLAVPVHEARVIIKRFRAFLWLAESAIVTYKALTPMGSSIRT
jgi:hypothetical protein